MGLSNTSSCSFSPRLNVSYLRPHSRTTLHGPVTFRCRVAAMSNFLQNRSLRLRQPALPCNPKLSHPSLRVHASNNSNSHASSSNTKLIATAGAVTATLAVANRVLYKLALVPMKNYPFFLAQITTFGYVAIYFSILSMRYRAGIVTDEMLALPKWRFMVIGILEALGVASGMSAADIFGLAAGFFYCSLGEKLLIQSNFWLLTCSYWCGGGCCQMLSGVEFVWPALMIASNAFQAGASIIKEFIFTDAATRLSGKSVDIFVVNSFGSGFQALFVLLFLPFLSKVKGIPFSQLPSYLKDGVGCLLNLGANQPGCDGAPLLPLLYIATNLAFNISVLNIVKISSAVVASLTVMLSVPIAIYILSLPLPYLHEATSLSPFFLLGSLILVSGLVLYNIPQPAKLASEDD